ncbi:TadE family protein [Ferrimonas pelagia]|uniref:TadE-like domain-containing protein n=1 Tax=Ferrimonas pelagia TaxID=1177826 RepID=A0ABP9EUS0_9GAMM
MRIDRVTGIKKQKGLAIVEMSIVAPILVFSFLAVFEMSQILQANNILVNISREGANLASRSLSQSPKEIVDALALTAAPLDLTEDGVVYISLVLSDGRRDPYVQSQYRWTDSGSTKQSQIWSRCRSRDNNGQCNMPRRKQRLRDFPLALDNGESVYVFEVSYDYDSIVEFIIQDELQLYSMSML